MLGCVLGGVTVNNTVLAIQYVRENKHLKIATFSNSMHLYQNYLFINARINYDQILLSKNHLAVSLIRHMFYT